jgi:hypothetical protein
MEAERLEWAQQKASREKELTMVRGKQEALEQTYSRMKEDARNSGEEISDKQKRWVHLQA